MYNCSPIPALLFRLTASYSKLNVKQFPYADVIHHSSSFLPVSIFQQFPIRQAWPSHPVDSIVVFPVVQTTSFHNFPVDAEIRARWVRAIRRNEGPSFKILCGSTYVCSQHLAPEDTYKSASGRTRIKKGAVPSRFPWNEWGKGRTVLSLVVH